MKKLTFFFATALLCFSFQGISAQDDCARTQTPGGWGSPPNGNNPGAYLADNFDAVFVNGLTVGSEDGHSITLTSAQAIQSLLPSSGKPRALDASHTDPAKSDIRNSLSNHVIALTISLGFDQAIADFGETKKSLSEFVILDGDFAGQSVATALAEANNILAGLESDYSASQITNVISKINESFVDGNCDENFFLQAPEDRVEDRAPIIIRS